MYLLSTLAVLATLGGTEQRLLLEFTSAECPACRTMETTSRRLLREGRPLRRIDVRKSPELAQRYAIRGLPTYVMFVGNREVGRVVGAVSYDRLMHLIRTNPTETNTTIRGQSPASSAREASRSNTNQLAIATTGRRGPFAEPWLNREPIRGKGSRPKATAPTSLLRASKTPQARAMAATVRLKIDDERGHSYGTGTVVDTRNGEALILTCGHIFRDSRGRGKISVDLFANRDSRDARRQTVPGRVIAYDLQQDVALVSMRPGVAIEPMQVAPMMRRVLQGDKVFSVGCDRGGEPQLRESSITAVNKYVGPANLEVAGAPVDGRSGGGLFTAAGLLVGVCNCADSSDDEGIYAANEVITRFLDSNKLGFVHRRTTTPTQHLASSTQQPIRQVAMTERIVDAMRSQSNDAMRSQDNRIVVLRPDERQVLDRLRQRLGTGEVTFVVRSLAQPIGKNNVYVLGQFSRNPALSDRQAVLKAIERAPDKTELICISRPTNNAQAGSEIVSLSRPSVRFIAELKRLLRL